MSTGPQSRWQSLVPWSAGAALLMASAPLSAQVSDAVNVPVQVRTSVVGRPAVNTQQLLHKSSLDPEQPSGEAGSVRIINDLTLDSVGLRLDLNASASAHAPGANGGNGGTGNTNGGATPTPTQAQARTPGSQQDTPDDAPASSLAHATLDGNAEAVVRLGATNTEIVNVSAQGLASSASIGGSCGSLDGAAKVAIGTTSLRVLGRQIELPENPEPNTEIPLTDIPGLAGGAIVLNEQTTFGDGANQQIVAVAPLRVQLRLAVPGVGGLADVEVSLGGNSASVDCTPEEGTPEDTPETPTPTTPESPTPAPPTRPTPQAPTPDTPTPDAPAPSSPTPTSPTPGSPTPGSPTPESPAPTPTSPTSPSPAPPSPAPTPGSSPPGDYPRI